MDHLITCAGGLRLRETDPARYSEQLRGGDGSPTRGPSREGSGPLFKFLHAADIHLDSPLRGLDRYEGCPVDEIRGATRAALKRLVDLAVAERVAFVLIAGDVYDGDWPDHGTGLFFARKMGELKDAKIPVYLISGNHDAKNKMTRDLRLPEGVHLLGSDQPETLLLRDIDVAIHGQSFATEKVTDDLATAYPPPMAGCFNIGLLHTSADGREGFARYAPCSVETLRSKGYDYWALGHVHTREEVDVRDVPIIFPGNVQGRHIREPGAKGCVVVTVDGHQTTRTFHPLDVLRWATCVIDATTLTAADGVWTMFGDQLPALLADIDDRKLAVRVEVVGSTPAHSEINAAHADLIAQIQDTANQAGSGRVWVEKVRFKTQPPLSAQRGEISNFDGPLGEIDHLLADLRTDPAELGRFAERELSTLQKKIGRELVAGEGFDLNSPAVLLEILGQIRPLLDAKFSLAKGAK